MSTQRVAENPPTMLVFWKSSFTFGHFCDNSLQIQIFKKAFKFYSYLNTPLKTPDLMRGHVWVSMSV
jgi:hypothetical protein